MLLRARYGAEAGEGDADARAKLYEEAIKEAPSDTSVKCQFWLGRFRDNQLADALRKAERREVFDRMRPGIARSCPDAREVKDAEVEQKVLDAYVTHLPDVLRAYGKGLKHGGKYAPRALPRLLTLWLAYADALAKWPRAPPAGAEKAHEVMESLAKGVPLHAWLPSTSHLVSRVCHRKQNTRELVGALLAKLLAEYTPQLAWAVVPMTLEANPKSRERKRAHEHIVAQAKGKLMGNGKGHLAECIKVASNVTRELKRVMDDQAWGKKEKAASMSRRWASLYRMKHLPLVVPIHATLTAAEPTPGAGASKHHRPFAEDAVTIDGWEDHVDVLSSLMRPKKVVVIGSDGQRYPLLAKPKDDLRKDTRMIEFMTLANRLMLRSAQCRRRRLEVRCYGVTPLGDDSGLIEWAANVLPIRSVVKEQWDQSRVSYSHHEVRAKYDAAKVAAAGRGEKARVDALARWCEGMMKDLPPVLHLWFVESFRAPSAWFDARLSYARSLGVMSMLGYAVGLGDRHLENLLIDATSGAAMHVDFGCLFDHGLNLEHPERVPFRLTQNLIHAMGVTGVEGVFRRVCELTLEQLRTHREALLDVIGTLRHDPLVDWRKRNAQEDESGVKDSAEATKELKKIDSKLNGIIESRGPTPLTVSGQVQALIAEATDINNLSQMYIWWMPWC